MATRSPTVGDVNRVNEGHIIRMMRLEVPQLEDFGQQPHDD